MFEVPRYLIAKKTLAGGFRLPKLPKPTFAKIIAPSTGLAIVPAAKQNIDMTVGAVMEFENWEYRYWCVEVQDPDAAGTAICRACETPHFLKGPRRGHVNYKGCGKRLTDAYKLLLRDMRCAICDSRTTYQYWGVPFCRTGSCVNKWMHEVATPNALMQALDLVAPK